MLEVTRMDIGIASFGGEHDVLNLPNPKPELGIRKYEVYFETTHIDQIHPSQIQL